jgi:hypothetical protein
VNQLYDVAINALLGGTLDLVTDPLMVKAYQWPTFVASDETLSDYARHGAAPVSTPAVALDGCAVENRRLIAYPVTLAELPEGEDLCAVVIYRADTDELVAFIDQRPDLAPLFVRGNGGPVQVRWAGFGANEVLSL